MLLPLTDATHVDLGHNLLDDLSGDGFFSNEVEGIYAVGSPSYVVTSLADAVDANLADSFARDAAGFTTLRSAIQEANDLAFDQTILVPAWTLPLTRSAAEATNDAMSDDLDIRSGGVIIAGLGAGLSVIDASGLSSNGVQSDDRIFEVVNGYLSLTKVTLTGGNAGGNGGAIGVHSGGSLYVNESVLVKNQTAGYGGALAISSSAGSVQITNSVILENSAPNGGGGIRNDKSGVVIGSTILANNAAFANRHDAFNAGSGSFVSYGNNLLTEISSTAPGLSGDFVGLVDYVVTSVQDAVDDDLENSLVQDASGWATLRAAVQEANDEAGAQTIWLPGWTHRLRLADLEATNDAASDDLDIRSAIEIRGVGAGFSVIDARRLGRNGIQSDDRIFDLDNGSLDLLSVTLARGNAGGNGGAILVRSGGSLNLHESALVDNSSLGYGGALAIFSTAGSVAVTDSVITGNSATVGGGGIRNDKAGVTIGNTILANNGAIEDRQDAFNVGSGSFVSLGNNMLTEISTTAPGLSSDFEGPVNYVVHSLAAFSGSYAPVRTLRDAIHQANENGAAEEIWLPAWNFILTSARFGEFDTSVGIGDLDITDSLVIRGINGGTSVAWYEGASPEDKVFDLLGDFNGISTAALSRVDVADYIVWRKWNGTGQPFGDADDDGDTDQDDYDLWLANFGNSLELIDVSQP